ncbi:MAG TPA: uracil phosphoribosyltransferase, partial [Bdellovibrionota bacterium]|nr:uracil phosphoribosyltransferase [Bdellovibrionota bacterium]
MNVRLQELEHHYGPRVHLVSHPLMLSWLAKLCAPETHQPLIEELITRVYTSLFHAVVNSQFPIKQVESMTRMAEFHPKEGYYRGTVVDPSTRAVTVNLARAGTIPSAIVYRELNYLLNPEGVRQD